MGKEMIVTALFGEYRLLVELVLLAIMVGLGFIGGYYVCKIRQTTRNINMLELLVPLVEKLHRCSSLAVQRGQQALYKRGTDLVEALRLCLSGGGGNRIVAAAEALNAAVDRWIRELDGSAPAERQLAAEPSIGPSDVRITAVAVAAGRLAVRVTMHAGATHLVFETNTTGASLSYDGPHEALLNSLPLRRGDARPEGLLDDANELRINEAYLRVWLTREAGQPSQLVFQWLKLPN